jgi:hypothetical protein
MATAANIQGQYINSFDKASKFFSKFSSSCLIYFEIVGCFRCAADLSRMGREAESRKLIANGNRLRSTLF